MTNTTAYRELVTNHNTMAYEGLNGRVSCRKQSGQYIVTIDRYNPSNLTKMPFKTLRGALIAYEEARGLIA